MALIDGKPTSPGTQRKRPLLAAGLIALATTVVYVNSFAGPFIFDDETAIVENSTIRQLWPLSKPLCPPNHGEPVTGRPVLNLSFAVDYAVSGYDVWSYHATNLAIHLLGSLLLFGILRRTFLLPAMRQQWGAAANPLAFVVALFWAIHPLQTESVTYISQRAESLVGLFYLLTLYCFIRGTDSPRATVWRSGAALACLAGMASKEVMVSAPLIVLLYDRAFLAGSFREAWRRRGRFYLVLAGTWVLLGWLVISAGTRGGAAGFGAGLSWWAYLCTQFGVIVYYLRLCTWPDPLVLDYGTAITHGIWEILPYGIALALLGAATAAALWRWPKVGFLGAWFFAILAPSSSVVPVPGQTVAEHRMYLPLAAVLTGLVVGGYVLGQRLACRQKISLRGLRLVDISLVTCVAVALGVVTFQRNAAYRSALSIWQDTVAGAPENARAQLNLGLALAGRGQADAAIAHYQKALEIKPEYADAQNNLGNVFAGRGQVEAAIAHYQKALEIQPEYADAHYNLGLALANRGLVEAAAAHYQKALEIQPRHVLAHNNLANVFAACGRFDEAISHYRKALEIQPDWADARRNCDLALAWRASILRGLAERRKLIRSRPSDANLLNDTAWVLATNPNASVRDGAEAVELAQRAVKFSGGQEPAILDTLAAAYAEAGRFVDAAKIDQQAIDLAIRQNRPTLAHASTEAKPDVRTAPKSGSTLIHPSATKRTKCPR